MNSPQPDTPEIIDRRLLKRWDRDHSWHPFTPMEEYLAQEPLIIERGEGTRLRDIDGRWYFDGCSSIWMNLHGHAHAAINQAVQRQLDLVAHATMLGQANVPATVLARRLCELAPSGLTRVQFSDCGAAAVEIAGKVAIQYWYNRGRASKRHVLGFQHNYHGDTLGAMAVAPSELFHKPFLEMLPYHPRLPFPVCLDRPWVTASDRCDAQHLAPVEDYLSAHADQVAAVLVEPVEGAGGMLPAPPGFLRGLGDACRRHEVLLIVDEVATGFGHTGHRFACTPESATPDILCLGKGLSGGYLPVAATLTTESLFEAFLGRPEERRTFYHGHSFAGNPLGCAAALASLDLLSSTLEGMRDKVIGLSQQLAALQRQPLVREIRQRGMMVGIPLGAPAGGNETLDDPWRQRELAMQAMRASREEGLLIRPIGNVVILLPPPIATQGELAEMVNMLERALGRVTESLPGIR